MKTEETTRFYFPELDGLRFLAFILVFVHHHPFFKTIPSLVFLKVYGWFGVDLFFVLSAFLFSRLLVEEYKRNNKISFRKFYLRRIFRIFPVYILFVTLIVIFLCITNYSFSNLEILRIVGLVTFTDNFMNAIYGGNSLSALSHLWTISFEEQFYVFVPIIILTLLKMTKKRKIVVLLSVVIVLSILRALIVLFVGGVLTPWMLPFTRFESILGGIIIGFGGYDFLLKYFKPFFISLMGVGAFFVFTLLPPVFYNYEYIAIYFLLMGLSTTLFLFGVMNSDFLKKIFSKKPLVYLGKRSYGLYLYHLLGIELSAYLLGKTIFASNNGLVSFLFALGITIFVSVLSYKFIEKPFLKLKKKYEVIKSRPI